MKLLSRKWFVSGLLVAFLVPAMVFAGDNKILVVEDVGFATPESVEYYAVEDVYLVTNINGSPLVADGNGFISKIKPDGSVVDLKWIDGSRKDVTLNAPKGAAIKGNILYVADLNQVHLFSLPSGKQITSVTVKGATFMNGITPGKGNYVYVTDSGLKADAKGNFSPSGSDAIYRVSASGKYKTILKDKSLGRPNGILTKGKDLLVVTFGTSEVYRVDAKGKRHLMPAPQKGSLDGFLKIGDRYLISSWGGSAIYALEKDGTYSTFAEAIDAPADMGYDSKRKRVLVPMFKQNKVIVLAVQ